jgi:SAM-dependent methyltransferase
LLAQESGLDEASEIADIGSGTGLLSRAFLDAEFKVTGVEPNREMREAGDMLLAGYSRFRSVDGRAEATTLADQSVDLIIAGQAFHWFDPKETRREWKRILRPGGTASLIWNDRFVESPFMREVEDVIDAFAGARDSDGAIREAGRSRIAGFFAPSPFQLTEFPNRQVFDFEGLLGRILSCSYIPVEGETGFHEMKRDLAGVFDKWQQAGKITFEYRTKVYRGHLTAG